MTNNEVLKIKSILEGNYPSIAKQDDMIYLSIMGEFDFSIMLQAVKNVIMKEKYPPNIAVILEEYKGVIYEQERFKQNNQKAISIKMSPEEQEEMRQLVMEIMS